MYTLYSYYRSSCSWRVRLALELKQIPYTLVQIDLLRNEQNQPGYIDEINPLGVVPALVFGDDGNSVGATTVLTQSIAILEYLEDVTSDTNISTATDADNNTQLRLLPEDPLNRQLVQIIAADCQPLQNLHVLLAFKSLAGITDDEHVRQVWGRPFIVRALQAYAKMLAGRPVGRFSCGDRVTMADLCLIPQLYNARRFGIDLEADFPALLAIEANFKAVHPAAFFRAHPDNSK